MQKNQTLAYLNEINKVHGGVNKVKREVEEEIYSKKHSRSYVRSCWVLFKLNLQSKFRNNEVNDSSEL
jgi:hypothetical protein